MSSSAEQTWNREYPAETQETKAESGSERGPVFYESREEAIAAIRTKLDAYDLSRRQTEAALVQVREQIGIGDGETPHSVVEATRNVARLQEAIVAANEHPVIESGVGGSSVERTSPQLEQNSGALYDERSTEVPADPKLEIGEQPANPLAVAADLTETIEQVRVAGEESNTTEQAAAADGTQQSVEVEPVSGKVTKLEGLVAIAQPEDAPDRGAVSSQHEQAERPLSQEIADRFKESTFFQSCGVLESIIEERRLKHYSPLFAVGADEQFLNDIYALHRLVEHGDFTADAFVQAVENLDSSAAGLEQQPQTDGQSDDLENLSELGASFGAVSDGASELASLIAALDPERNNESISKVTRALDGASAALGQKKKLVGLRYDRLHDYLNVRF